MNNQTNLSTAQRCYFYFTAAANGAANMEKLRRGNVVAKSWGRPE